MSLNCTSRHFKSYSFFPFSVFLLISFGLAAVSIFNVSLESHLTASEQLTDGHVLIVLVNFLQIQTSEKLYDAVCTT